MDENDILDDQYNSKDLPKKPKEFNYAKYSLTYIFLMILVGVLLTKLMSESYQNYQFLLAGAFVYIAMAFVLALIQFGINYVYRQIVHGDKKIEQEHPIWFRLLESCFYIWCVITIVSFVGNKVI